MITAVIPSWNRPYHIPEIVENLRKHPQVTECIIYCNEHPPADEITDLCDQQTRCIHNTDNTVTLSRFLGGQEAANDIIFTHDDDLLVHNLDALLSVYDGTQIVANLADDDSSRHWNWWQVHKLPYVELGFGSVFPKRFCAHMPEWPYCQELLRRKADKVFTIINPWVAQRAGPEDLTRLFHDGVESGRDQNSLSLRSDHHSMTARAVELAQQWKEQPENKGESP